MGWRYRPPRYAKPWKPEKDEDLEETIRQIQVADNEAKIKREREKEGKEK